MLCFQELISYVMSFKQEESTDPRSHPVQLVVEMLGHPDPSLRGVHCDQLGKWYSEYATLRQMPFFYKDAKVVPWL